MIKSLAELTHNPETPILKNIPQYLMVTQ